MTTPRLCIACERMTCQETVTDTSACHDPNCTSLGLVADMLNVACSGLPMILLKGKECPSHRRAEPFKCAFYAEFNDRCMLNSHNSVEGEGMSLPLERRAFQMCLLCRVQ